MVIDLPELAFGSTATVKRLVNSQFFEPTYGEKMALLAEEADEGRNGGGTMGGVKQPESGSPCVEWP